MPDKETKLKLENFIDKNVINANIKLQDMNKILEKENAEYKRVLYSVYNYLKNYDEIERVHYLLQDIKEVLGL